MSYDLWRKLEEEEDSETKGRRPEIGHIFLLDRGKCCPALSHPWVLEGRGMDNVLAKLGPKVRAVNLHIGCEHGHSWEVLELILSKPNRKLVWGSSSLGSWFQTWTL